MNRIFKKLAVASAILGLSSAVLFAPIFPVNAGFNQPATFGPLTGDCTTPSAASTVTTCTKFNGQSLASMALQSASAVGILGGTIDGTTIGGTVKAALGATTGTFTGLLTGVANTFTGLSTQTGGHVVGTLTATANITLVAANEQVCANAASAFTITLPVAPAEGEVHEIADCGYSAATYNITIVAGAGGVKVNNATNYVITNNGQAIRATYRSAFGWIFS